MIRVKKFVRAAWHVVSWILLVLFILSLLVDYPVVERAVAIAASYGVVGSIALLVGAPIIMGVLVLGVFDSLPRQRCTYCGGSGVIAAGAWTSIYDASDCPHCGGSGYEPTGSPISGGGW